MAEPFLGQVEMFSFGFPPKGWATCGGQLLPIQQNQALFSLLGTTYGGDGQTTYALPDLRSRVPVGQGQGTGLSSYTLGQKGGEEAHTVSLSEMAGHNHNLRVDATTAASNNVNAPATNVVLGQTTGAPAQGALFPLLLYAAPATLSPLDAHSIAVNGGSQAHTNIMPYLALNFCIALQGIFPSPN
jgi:microcystin-dependent protein